MQPGDHLVVSLFGGLAHHGIYVGNGRVIHWDSGIRGRVGPLDLLFRATRARVRETSLVRFCNGRTPQARRYHRSLDARTVIARARSRLGERGYDLMANNCEQLAAWCKTGRHRSRQVGTARRTALIVAVLTAAAVGLALVGAPSVLLAAGAGCTIWAGRKLLAGSLASPTRKRARRRAASPITADCPRG